MLSQFQVWKNLPEQVVQEVEKVVEKKIFNRGDILYRADEEPRGIYFITKGLVGLVVVGLSGQEHLVRLYKCWQFFGHRSIFAQEKYHATATALEETHILFVKKDVLCDLIRKHWEISFSFLEVMARDLKRAEQRIVSRSELDVTARVAESLVYLKDMYPHHRWTRKEIADFCGSTTPTVIKVLAKLEAEGLIKQEGREIIINSRDELLSLGA